MPEPPATPSEAPAPDPLSKDQIAAERRRGKRAGIAALLTVALILGGAAWSGTIDTDDTGGKPVIKTKQAQGQAKAKTDGKDGGKQTKDQQKQKEQSAGDGGDSAKQDDDAPPAPAETRAQTEAKKKADERKQKIEDDQNRVDDLASADRNPTTFVAIGLLTGLGIMLILVPALHLQIATSARRRNPLPVLKFVAVYGPLALGLSLIIRAFALKHASADFVDQTFLTLKDASDEAKDLTAGGVFDVVNGLAISGVIATAFWLVKGNYDAFNVGLLPRSLSILGMGLPLLVLFFAPIGIFWLLAVGGLFLGVWPGPMPAAWTEGKAVPWPKRQPGPPPGRRGRGQQEPAEVGGERNGDVKAVGPGVRGPGGADDDPPDPGQTPRKRKRRGG